jgi:FtsP/CotA-like multicopper oxidase with cupredoxin domain
MSEDVLEQPTGDRAVISRRTLLQTAAGGGALALLGAKATDAPAATGQVFRPSGRVHEYWIAAVNTTWDIAPNGRDAVMGTDVAPEAHNYQAIVYRRFTPGWKRPWPNSRSGDNGGIPGPTIRAEVGDTVLVHFKNLDAANRYPHSMHFHAFRYAPSSDGAFIPLQSGRGASVPYGKSFTYRLVAVEDSYGVWPYHDHAQAMHESIAAGMYGQIVITRPGERPPDREFVVYFAHHGGFDTINGRAFIGNTPTFRARAGELVQWNVLTIGDLFHTFHIHGHRWRRNGVPTDVELLGPASSLQVRFREDMPGTWYYHCHVESHMRNGMIGLYRVDG